MTMSIGSAPGNIEFSCANCGRTLKVPAAAAGKRASCPQCNAVVQVPGVDGAAGTLPPAMSPPAPLSMGDSFPQQPASSAPAPPAWASAPAATLAPQTALPAAQPWAPPPQPAAPAPTMPPQHIPSIGQPGFRAPATVNPPAAPHLAPQVAPGRDTPTKRLFDRITTEIAKLYVGQDELVLGALVALFSNGHVLIESVPGLGKTLFVRALGKVMGLRFGRIQFTADLMPSDVTGAPVLDMKTQDFRFRPGPVFTQLLLADEINRAPAKTHASLLEIMQEYRVTVDGKSHPIERPFLVLATQNPIESEGTYNLPEAQLDRFMFKLVANYPQEAEEATILKLHSQQNDLNKQLDAELSTITSAEEILATIHENAQVRVDDRLVDYINKVVRRTREWPQFHMGASPRAGIALMQAARTLAAFSGRDYAVPDDVFQIALPALRHRVVLTAEAEVEGQKVDDLLTELIRTVEVPRL
ncbi:MAG: AAA family ATPase [Pirellulaceae bacterium]|nr:AAA family ATPase [Pirellulaceae bacterium]